MATSNNAVIPPNLSNQRENLIALGADRTALLKGEVLLETRSHSLCGGAVTAQMYLPMKRSQAWVQLTNYSRWIHYFPDIVQSEVLDQSIRSSKRCRRLYQVARKAFLMFSAQVEIYLKVFETLHQQIQFRLERGAFSDFAADLTLQDYEKGTLLTYSVQATPLVPVPSFFIQQAIQQDLPGNMKKMRQVICS
ncbi:MAG: SRPBCC family protein [Leptolyngbyaceae cyanobacterium MO_188.B28]|nr:SRPBCC family protein [Leptolyngbyaceae cyanobacterium MO_188.B28]